MIDYLNLPVGADAPEIVNVVVEVPFGGVNKYEYDPKLQIFRLDRSLYSPAHFPGDYGFIPQTKAIDGEALDILVLVDNPNFCSCLLQARPIGMLEMMDRGVTDQKIVAVHENNPRYAQVKEVTDLYGHVAKEIEHFFRVYKALETTETNVVGWSSMERAREIIQEAMHRFAEPLSNQN